MPASGVLRQTLRVFQLPMRAGREWAGGRALLCQFRSLDLPSHDFLNWANLELGLWRDNGRPSAALKSVIAAILRVADIKHGGKLAERYFDLHNKLINEHLMSHDQAVAFLSHTFLISDLASNESLSAAQIAKLIGRRDQRISFSRQSIATVLQGLRLLPEIDLEQLRRGFHMDAKLELPMLADADLITAAEVVSTHAEQLGFRGSLYRSLQTLMLQENGWNYTPYLQILHYQSTVAEYFDHAVTDLYEFSPRGQAANWLFEQYPTAMASAGNPFLNNAKSVEKVDQSWVRSKKPNERPGAAALLDVLSGMEEMGFAARRELARWIRLWLHRIFRFAAPLEVAFPNSLTPSQVESLFRLLRHGNTLTYGILEQRVVDCAASLSHPIGQGWRPKGLGDSVNATNLSQRKLGDCDFQNSELRQIIAYESHGGVLTDVYVREHFRTLDKAIQMRKEELLGVADLCEWEVIVKFVAHQVTANLPSEIFIQGLRVRPIAISFVELIDNISGLAGLHETINAYVAGPLGERRTPSSIRIRVLNSL